MGLAGGHSPRDKSPFLWLTLQSSLTPSGPESCALLLLDQGRSKGHMETTEGKWVLERAIVQVAHGDASPLNGWEPSPVDLGTGRLAARL